MATCPAGNRQRGSASDRSDQLGGKPEGIAVEMADCLIRILDWFGHEGLDVDGIVREKMLYNKGRPYKHGKKC